MLALFCKTSWINANRAIVVVFFLNIKPCVYCKGKPAISDHVKEITPRGVIFPKSIVDCVANKLIRFCD